MQESPLPPLRRMPHQPDRVNVLGVGVSAISTKEALAVIDDAIAAGERSYVCVTGVHGVMESCEDPDLRLIHNRARLVTPDGMPMVWIAWLRGLRHVERVYGPDLMLACCRESVPKRYRHFLYGGAPGVAERLEARLLERIPGLIVAGTLTPPFRDLSEIEEQQMLERVAAARPDIVWVGLSTPKQERWMARYVDRLGVPVLIGVGAAFDFHAGLKKQAPRWVQRSGFEWLFRLSAEPRRLWRRYLFNNPRFVWRYLLQLCGFIRYEMAGDPQR